ncbi:MAG: glucose-6-phosphate isomerase family protein [Candidatus Micrarchaeota archaeon]
MDTVLYEKPMRVELVGTILFVQGSQTKKTTRTLSQMQKTLMSPPTGIPEVDMYYMYRNVYKADDIRFDVTVIPSTSIKGECAKTHGHYHPGSEEGPAYPEVYQVLRGQASFVLQKKNRNGSVDVMVVNAGEGDAVLLPPGWGHVSVNRGDDVLVLSNLVYDRFESLYSEYEDNQGAAYYIMKDGELVHNTNYIVHEMERLSAKELASRHGFSCGDLLQEFHADPRKFGFLKSPKLLFKG